MKNSDTRPSFWEAIKSNDDLALLQFLTGTPIALIIIDISQIMSHYLSKAMGKPNTTLLVSLVSLVNIYIAWSKAKEFVYVKRSFLQGAFLYGTLKAIVLLILIISIFILDEYGVVSIQR